MNAVHPLFSRPLSVISGELVGKARTLKFKDCPACEGEGYVWIDCTMPHDFEPRERQIECDRCVGSGQVFWEEA